MCEQQSQEDFSRISSHVRTASFIRWNDCKDALDHHRLCATPSGHGRSTDLSRFFGLSLGDLPKPESKESEPQKNSKRTDIYIYIHTIEHELNRIQYRLYKLHMFEIPDMLLSNTEPIADWCAGGGRVSNPSLRSHKSTAEVAEPEEAVPHGPVERSDAKQTGRSWP